MKTFLIPTSQAEHLAKNILKKKRKVQVLFPYLNREKKRYFPDGEVYVRILNASKLKNKKVAVLHSGAPEPNGGLVELDLILQVLKDYKIEPEVFFSYFPYSMQDKIFEKGETNVAENLIEKLINYYRVKKIYIIDPHFGGKKWVEKYCAPNRTYSGLGSIISISAVPLLIEKAKQDFGEDILFLAPDVGEERRTKIRGFRKERLNSYQVKIKNEKKTFNLKGKIVGVVDDIVETGRTLDSFYDECKKLGAEKVIALITHGVLLTGISTVKKKYLRLYLANTIKQPARNALRSNVDGKEANIDITDLILENIETSNYETQ